MHACKKFGEVSDKLDRHLRESGIEVISKPALQLLTKNEEQN